MIHELRMYTIRPGAVPKVIEASGTVARRIREGDKYGTLEGHWSSEIGLLSQYVHLWSYENIAEMTRLRAELTKKDAWRNEFLPLMHPHIISQRIRILKPVIPMNPVEGEGNIYEFRNYRVKTGRGAAWTARMAQDLAAREKYSKVVGVWNTVLPDPNEVCHLWVYESFEARMEARAASQADPVWQEFLSFGGPLLEEMHSTILIPSPYSPRK